MAQLENKIGKYTLLETLGIGGMGEVYLGRYIGGGGIPKFVAIKKVSSKAANKSLINLFKYEAVLAIKLNHNSIAKVNEFGVSKGQFFIVMDFIDGQNLKNLLWRLYDKNKILGQDMSLFIAKEVAHGLEYARRCMDPSTGLPLTIVHKDISPHNIMLNYEGELKIIDFGAAHAEAELEKERENVQVAKQGYMSPEQARGDSLDHRSDIFCLGIVLWEMLTGERLFTQRSEADFRERVSNFVYPDMSQYSTKIPEDIEKVVMKALSRDTINRYQTAGELYEELNFLCNKHFPSFSQNQVRKFVQNEFKKEMEEWRKKMIQYSAIQRKVEDTGETIDTSQSALETEVLSTDALLDDQKGLFKKKKIG